MSRRWVTRSLKAIVLALGSVALLLAAAGAAFWWWAGTEGSLAWMLRQVARSQPLLVEGATGSLRSGLSVQRLVWERGGLKVEARGVQAEWKPLELLTGALQFDRLSAAAIRIEDRRPPQPRVLPQSLALRLRPAVDDLRVDRLEWITAGNAVTASQLAGHYSFNGLQHQVQVDSLRWGTGSYRGSATIGAAGALHVRAALDGRFEAEVPGHAAALPLDFAVTLLGPLADLQAKGRLQVGTGSAAAGTRASGSARLTLWAEQPVPQAQADFQQLDVSALWPQAPRTSLAGQVRVQPAGTASWALTADIANALPGPWNEQRLPVAKLSAQGEWRAGGEALVRRLHAQVGGGELEAHGRWRSAGQWAATGRLAGVDPAALYSGVAPVPVSGTADLHGEGRAVDFEVELQAAGGRRRERRADELAATVQALELRRATARGRWDGALLAMPAFEVRTADARAAGELQLRPADWSGGGKVTLDAPGLRGRAEGRLAEAAGAGTVQLQAANLGAALRWLQGLPRAGEALAGMAANGRADARLAWQGGWRDPAVQGRIEVPLLELAADGAGRDAKKPAPWSLRDAVANVSGRLSDARVDGRGRAEFGDRRIGLEVAGQGGRRSQAPAAWQGQVSALHLSATDPSLGAGTWTLQLQDAFGWRWSAGQFEAGAGQALLRPPAPSGAAAGAPARLAWEPVRWGGGELRTAGRLTGLPMAWIGLLGGPQLAGSALSGDMVFDGQWDASLGATPRVRAALVRSRGDVTVLAESADGSSTRVQAGVREARLALESDGDALSLSLRWDSERGGSAHGQLATRLAAGGAAGWNWPQDAPLAGTLQAQLPRIGVWSLLAPPGWRLRGSVAANITVAGTRGDPRLSGTLGADDLALRSVVDGIELQGGRLRAHLDGQRLLVDEFMLRGSPAGGGDGGTLVATGEGAWTANGPQAQLTARLNRLRASIRSDRQLTVSGQLAARVDAAQTEVTGQLAIDRALLVLPEESTPQLGDDVVVRGAATRPTRTQARAAEAERPGGRRLRIAVDLDLGNDFRVRGHGIDTRLRGTLAVSGQSLAAPRLTGTIRTAGGEYQAYGQRLDIERGVLRFTGPVDNPSLDILAVRPNLAQRVGVQITGSVLTPYVRLYSEPELPDAEKLSWLVVGRASAAGGAEAALVQRAALALLSGRSGSGKRGVAASLGLDELTFNRSGPEGPAVTFGKRLGRNFYAAYERSLSGALGTLFVFYDLTRRVTVRAEAGTRTAMDLIFTFTFD
ncbi:translocation/assembly module TamB domain-containing protein [Ramlibacter sp.]|uniref:translocation/assembly module TamB domain-containing protein n=1 Tax=Ramlibacter sp. TaxID=1917967 RepID=UPI002CF68358|nr:translocation/assembly module TamB domain-containing protein [Ramlibacter sp.]HWI82261.1 translocation/assembly module TamB domain-containing protein [Ramlibacter sp.]